MTLGNMHFDVHKIRVLRVGQIFEKFRQETSDY